MMRLLFPTTDGGCESRKPGAGRSLRALVLDLDDTLFSERDYVLSGFRAVGSWIASVHGIHGFAEAASALFEGGQRGRIFDDVLLGLGLENRSLVETLVSVYREHTPEIELFDDAKWVLRRYVGEFFIGVLTDGYLIAQQRKFAALRLDEFVDHVVFTDALGRQNWKPSPVPYQTMMDVSGCPGANCIYVGDNPHKDFIAARSLGWTTVQIKRPGGEYCEASVSELHQADHRIDSLYELDAILTG